MEESAESEEQQQPDKYSLEDYNSLKQAIASGVFTVKYGETTVTYRGIESMQKILRMMESELFDNSVNGQVRHVAIRYDGGDR